MLLAAEAPSNPRSYTERLACLTKQRREREKELLHLLSDIDAGRSPSKQKDGKLPDLLTLEPYSKPRADNLYGCSSSTIAVTQL